MNPQRLNVPEYTIRLSNNGNVIEGLTIEGGSNGDRDKKTGTLIQEGGVLFLTPAGKKFFQKYSQFSFVFNRKAAPRALAKAA